MNNKLIVILVTSVIYLLAFNSAEAMMKEKSLKEITTEANVIVLGKVVDVKSYFNKRGEILSNVLIENKVSIGKNLPEDRYVTITVLGGEVGDIGLSVSDMPEFAVNEAVMVFLTRKSQSYETVGFAQGKYTFSGSKVIETGQDSETLIEKVFDILEGQTEASFQDQRAASKRFVDNLESEQIINPDTKDFPILTAPSLSSCTQPSGYKWNSTNVGYTVGSDIPWNWIGPIANGASAWNQSGSRFRFSAGNNSNKISFKNFGANSPTIALTSTWRNSTNMITQTTTQFNSAYSFSTTGESGKFDVQNTMAHEFGHWLNLKDIYTGSCSAVTMYGYQSYGTTYQRTLEPADIEGIIAIYGR